MTGYAEHHRQQTDRQAYISALETQLQRATRALAVVQTFTEKVDMMQTQLNSVEDKVININRLFKLRQSVSDGHTQELQRLNAELSAADLAKSGYDSGLLTRKVETLELRVRELEERTVEESQSLPKARVFKEIDLSLRETEGRIAAVLEQTNLDVEHKHKVLQEQVKRTVDQCYQDYMALDRRLANVEARQPGTPQRFSNELFYRGDSSFAAELREVKESAWNCELTCNRLAEDSLKRISACEQLLRDLESTVRESLRARDARISNEELADLNKNLSDKLSEAVDRMGKVVRKSSEAAKTLITEVTGLERRTKSLERSIDVGKVSPVRPSRSTTSSPKTIDNGARDKLEEKPPKRIKSAPRAKTPPKKEPSKNPIKEPRKKSITHKKAHTPRSTQKKSPSQPPLSPPTLKSKARDASKNENLKRPKIRLTAGLA